MTCQEWALSPFCYATAAPETREGPSPGPWLNLAVEGFYPSLSPVCGVCVCDLLGPCVHYPLDPTSSSQPLQRAWPTCLLHFPWGMQTLLLSW